MFFDCVLFYFLCLYHSMHWLHCIRLVQCLRCGKTLYVFPNCSITSWSRINLIKILILSFTKKKKGIFINNISTRSHFRIMTWYLIPIVNFITVCWIISYLSLKFNISLSPNNVLHFYIFILYSVGIHIVTIQFTSKLITNIAIWFIEFIEYCGVPPLFIFLGSKHLKNWFISHFFMSFVENTHGWDW